MSDQLLSVKAVSVSSMDIQRGMLFAAVLALPFTSFSGVPQLGELQGSLSVHILLALLAVSVIDGKKLFYGSTACAAIIATCVIVVAISLIANSSQIEGAEFKGRTGYGKLLTSSVVMMFGGLVLAQLPRFFSSHAELDRIFVFPVVISLWVVAFAAVPEILSWSFPWGGDVYALTTGLLVSTGQFGEVWREPGRLASLAFEAPDLAYYLAFCAPWVLYSYRTRKAEGKSLWRVGLTLLLVFLLEGLAGSRTGYLMLGGWCLTEVVCTFVVGRIKFNQWLLYVPLALLAALAVMYALNPDGLASSIDAFGITAYDERNISNISRTATASTQLCQLLGNRWFGVGFGQYAFQAIGCLPDWSIASFEINTWFFSPEGGFPPTFSAIGRIASELGLVGIIAFFGILYAGLRFFIGELARVEIDENGRSYIIACISSLVVLALGAFSSDFIRRPETWMMFAVLTSHQRIIGRH